VLSLARGLRVIESFEGRPDGLSIAEISRVTAFSRAAVRRLLITLQLLGYIESTGRRYHLRDRDAQTELPSTSPASKLE
jgi:IclR family pca regulon transcriptional regulator